MQQENQFLRSLFDNAPFPYQSLDSDGRILSVNKAWQAELKYTKHEVLGRWFGDFVCSDQRAFFRRRFAEFIEDGCIQGAVWQLVRKDGSTLQVSFSGRIAQDEGSRFLQTQCMFFDLSKRSEAEEGLRAAEALRMAFMESAEDGFGILDENLHLIYINEHGARLLGATPEDLLGKAMSDLSHDTAHAEPCNRFQQVLNNGESFSTDEVAFASPLGERRLAVSAFKVEENLGLILRDVGEDKLARQQLQTSEARWRSMVEDNPDHVVSLDQDLRIEHANSALPGFTAEERLGTYAASLADPSQQQRVLDRLQHALLTGESAQYEWTCTNPAGGSLEVESHVAPRIVDGHVVGLIVCSRDVSQRKIDGQRTRRLLERQTAMASLAMALSSDVALNDVYRTTYQHVKALMDPATFTVSRFDVVLNRIRPVYRICDGEERLEDEISPADACEPPEGPVGEVIRSGKPLVVSEDQAVNTDVRMRARGLSNDPEGQLFKSDEDGRRLPSSALLVPMRNRDTVVGVIQIQSYKSDAFKSDDAELLSGLAGIASVAIENHERVNQLQNSYEGVIRALAKAIELRDPYTKQHQEGVARLATRMGQILGLPDEQIRAIELAANIHDIGKVIIPAEILSKPTLLTGAQRSIVQSHVLSAYEVLEDIDFPWDVDEIVLQHHERLDGSGYPNGLQGDAIRLEARILGVADIADAMLSHRPYRPAHSLEETVTELVRLRGSALDEDVVDACLLTLKQNAS